MTTAVRTAVRADLPVAPAFRLWLGAEVLFGVLTLLSLGRYPEDTAERFAWPIEPTVMATALGALYVSLTPLLVLPATMVDVWPWPITTLLAQIYFAPLLAYGVGSVVLATQRGGPDVRVGAATMLVFAVGVLVASALHLDLFSAGDVSDWLWFLAFGAAATGLAAITAWSFRSPTAAVAP